MCFAEEGGGWVAEYARRKQGVQSQLALSHVVEERLD